MSLRPYREFRTEHFQNVHKTLENIRQKVLTKHLKRTTARQPKESQTGSSVPALSSTSMRLRKELMDISVNPPPLCGARLRKGDLHEWVAVVKGPPGSVYSGGQFYLSVIFPKEYPLRPPVVKFTTRIYHCNVNPNGTICLDALRRKWSPEMTMSSVLLSICSLLMDCNPYDPLVINIASLYLKNRNEHDRLARYFTRKFACPKMLCLG